MRISCFKHACMLQISALMVLLLCFASCRTSQSTQDRPSRLSDKSLRKIRVPAPLKSKKGICLAPRNHPDWRNKIKLVKAHWLYTWASHEPSDMPESVPFVPMVWGYDENIDRQCRELTQRRKNGEFSVLLGFNEPDHKKQSNMTVEKALDGWTKLMATGLRLGSPAASSTNSPWIHKFMRQAIARGYRVDFIAVHWYGGPNPKAFLQRLEKVHRMYNRPIWITEFAVADWKASKDRPNIHSPEKIYKFMQAVIPKLNKLDYIERYAWYSVGHGDKDLSKLATGTSVLFNRDGTMTKLGKLYASF